MTMWYSEPTQGSFNGVMKIGPLLENAAPDVKEKGRRQETYIQSNVLQARPWIPEPSPRDSVLGGLIVSCATVF